MKKIFLSVTMLALAIIQQANAQATNTAGQPNPSTVQAKTPTNVIEDRAKRQTDIMAKELNLDDATKAKVQTINLKYARKQDDINSEMQQMRKDEDNDLKNTLTADQYKTYMEKRMPPRPGMGQPHPQVPNPQTPAQAPAQPK